MNFKHTLIASGLALLTCLPLAAFAQDSESNPDAQMPMATTLRLDPAAPNPAPPHPELAGVLQQDFGGKQGLATIVETFMGNMMGAYKSIVANEYLKIWKSRWTGAGPVPILGKIWHRNLYEHIIRNEHSYQNISNYIINNPKNWKDDKFFPQ